MDAVRQIRLLIPPFFFILSIVWGGVLAGSDFRALMQKETATFVIGAVVASLLPLGYLISAVSVSILRFVDEDYEARLPDKCLERIWPHLESSQQLDPEKRLYIAATFDHELLSPGVHEWLLRRWNSFNIGAHSVTALLLAHLAGGLLGIDQKWQWWSTSGVIAVILVIHAKSAWRQTMLMVEFQSYRPKYKKESESRKAL